MRGLLNLGSDYVYRALRTDEDPYKNIVATAPNSKRSIDEHVEDGLKFPSRYISTSVSFELADKWRTTSYQKNLMKYKRGTTIVKIDINYIKRNHLHIYSSAYDFTKRENRNLYLDGRSLGYARGYREVVFDRSIPFLAISDIYIEGKGWVGNQRPLNMPTPVSAPTTSTTPASSIPNLNHNPTPVTTSTTPASSIPNLNHNPTPVTTSTIPASSIPNLTHNPTPVTTSTIPASYIPNHNPIPVSTLSVHPTSSTQSISHVIDTNDNTVGTEAIIINTSTPISSPSHFYSPFDLSEDTDTYLSAFEKSADIIDVTTPCDTAEKRSTGVKRSCEVDSEITPAKYVCVVDQDTQVSNVFDTHLQGSEYIIPEE